MKNLCQRVFVLGLDGAIGESVREAETPHLDALWAEGVVTYEAQTVMPTSSYPAWGAMFHGVGPDKHRIDGHHPCPEDSVWPSFMKVAKQARPHLRCASFSCWKPINTHFLEPSCECYYASQPDPELVQAAGDYIRQEPPDLFFMQLDFIVAAGHKHGYRSPEYLEQITATDQHVGLMVQAIREARVFPESLLVVLSDHGGWERTHGTDHPDCLNTFWGCRGVGITRGIELPGEVNIMDTAAVVARALGLDPPPGWDAQVPEGVFKE